ncbi:lysozyme family protein [Amycolatopsis panacis]|uniref:Murein transglycosylase n=1 Tax=Amycolatopsis panacis TaxID=2340917 RepID=A0A419IBL5_9PSEU|nr:murein transglycosylase [Amycolatopsis panacis]RJQ92358.1 murein transglycosylase [Amycolatopsis panacis]
MREVTCNARRRPLAVRFAGLLAVLVLAVGWVLLASRLTQPFKSATTTTVPPMQVSAASVAPGSATPASADSAGTRPSTLAGLAGWAHRVARVTGVPARALEAYGNGELRIRATRPDCRLSWATLAGLGRIESDHGQYGGAKLGADGRPSVPIVGTPLPGAPGSQGHTHARALGPMQFMPGTWSHWGTGDPQQIDNAALAAARYLCAGGHDLGTAAGWWSAVLSYDDSVEFARKVFTAADRYARATAHLGG